MDAVGFMDSMDSCRIHVVHSIREVHPFFYRQIVSAADKKGSEACVAASFRVMD